MKIIKPVVGTLIVLYYMYVVVRDFFLIGGLGGLALGIVLFPLAFPLFLILAVVADVITLGFIGLVINVLMIWLAIYCFEED